MTDFEWSLSQVIANKELPRDDFYFGWKRDDFLAFQKRLHRIVNQQSKSGVYRLTFFTSSVYKSEFDSMRPDELKDDPECTSYYIFNVANLMKQIAWWGNRNFKRYQHDPVTYIFSKGDREGANLENWFNHCWEDEGDCYYYRLNKDYSHTGYDLQCTESEVALQAADMATFELSKVTVEVAARGHNQIPLEELRKSLPSLCKAPHFSFTLAGSELKAAFAQIISQRASRKADRLAKVIRAKALLESAK